MKIQEVRVAQKGVDLKGRGILEEAKETLNIKGLKAVRTARVYRLEGITEKQAKILKDLLFCENITQISTLNRKLINNTPCLIEVGYKPGVMNPEIASIIKSAKDLGINLIAADASTEYGFYGKIDKKEIALIVEKLLVNKIVERLITQKPKTLIIKGTSGKTSAINIRKMDDKELMSLSRDKLFLNLEEMKVIQNYFIEIKRDPTDCELETFAQTWSEHCAHKTFKANLIVDGKVKLPLIERIKNEAWKHHKNIVSAFIDNSGVMKFYDGFGICGKVETHNSPSAIEPYGGAMTGSGGVFRDVLGTGQGAKTIASTDFFCFANTYLSKKDLPAGCLPPEYLFKRVVHGVRDYGNRMGIPTNNGSVHFHDDFRAKPTVIVGAYGILPTKKAKKGVPVKGDFIIAVGGKTGRDGIHGNTFASAEMTDRTISINSSAVQIGNAIEEKRMFDAIIEVSDRDLIRAITDCGAGGFSSAIGEIGSKTGVRVDLSKASLKYHGLSPWEIWISESQERMVLAIDKKHIKEVLEVCKKYNVEASILGRFTNTKKLEIYYGKKLVASLSMEFLHHGLPQRNMTAIKPGKNLLKKQEPLFPKNQKEWTSSLKKVLSHGNVCSKEPVVRLYDHSVQGTNILQPFSGELMDGPNDAAVIRPLLDKPYGMIVSHGLNPILVRLNPYWGSIWAATEAISNYAAVGGDYKNASLINNYIWPFPDEKSLWSLDKSVDAVCDFMNALKIPVISGKDSLSSTYRGQNREIIKIPPVLCISVFGKIPDVKKTISSDFKKPGSVIVLVGKQDLNEMGGSTYFDVLKTPGRVPHVDLKKLPQILNTIYNAIQKNQILSCHDISEGGLITAVFEMCVGGNMGATIYTSEVDYRPDYFLFNETAGCFILELENREVAKKLFKDIPYLILGKTQKEKDIVVKQKNKTLFEEKIEVLKKVWQEPMKKIFEP